MNDPKALSVQCNHCGGPLEVQVETRFVTCAFCGSSLELIRSGNALYTEVLDRIEQRAQRIEADVDELRRHAALAQLDRDWDGQRARLTADDTSSRAAGASPALRLVAAGVAVAFGLFWISRVPAVAAPMRLFGMVFVGVAAAAGIGGWRRARRLQDEERRYLARRRQILHGDRG